MNTSLCVRLTAAGFVVAGPVSPAGLLSDSLSWARSAYSLACPYSPNGLTDILPEDSGLVAAFAVGGDYRSKMKEMLHKVLEPLHSSLGHYSVHVDDPKIMERALAQRAGLGWIGRNRCLFTSEYGSYVYLGEILLEDSLPSSAKTLSHMCGGCNLCVSACPTAALSDDGFDRTKCISFLTQKRGVLNEFDYSAFGQHIYGCDICQQVCPMNASVIENVDLHPKSAFPGTYVRLCEAITMDKIAWQQLSKGSSVSWIGRNTWRRNAAIVAGNIGTNSLENVLREACGDESSSVNHAAHWALERLQKRSL